MRILLHACCAPCLVHPFSDLQSLGHDVTTVFFNPNIQPYSEYLRRLEAFKIYTESNNIKVLNDSIVGSMEEWLREVVYREAQKCTICFNYRLDRIAEIAEIKGFDAFSTTLLYSRFQKHELLKEVGEAVAANKGISFFYKDWRKGWNDGVKRYRPLGLYRQKYCGCIYSEKERAAKIV